MHVPMLYAAAQVHQIAHCAVCRCRVFHRDLENVLFLGETVHSAQQHLPVALALEWREDQELTHPQRQRPLVAGGVGEAEQRDETSHSHGRLFAVVVRASPVQREHLPPGVGRVDV